MFASVGRSSDFHPSRITCLISSLSNQHLSKLKIFFVFVGLTKMFGKTKRWSDLHKRRYWIDKCKKINCANLCFLQFDLNGIWWSTFYISPSMTSYYQKVEISTYHNHWYNGEFMPTKWNYGNSIHVHTRLAHKTSTKEKFESHSQSLIVSVYPCSDPNPVRVTLTRESHR